MEPALHEQSPLESKSSDQEVESYAAEAVPFQEGHEETKSNKDHHMHVLEAWREKQIFPFLSPLNIDSPVNDSFLFIFVWQ